MISGTAQSEPGRADEAQMAAAAPTWAIDGAIAVALALVVAAIFIGTLHGEFVYDDDRQIVQNTFLQDPSLYGTALLSDVWAFKGDRGQAWSNYWRPTFVAWLIVNANLFGVDSPLGWRVTNILLHCLVTVLAFGLMRTLGMGRWLAAGAALVFAAHPVHVESVAWISGSPDMLMSIGLIGALWATVAALRRPRMAPWVAAWILYATALLAKEAALLFPAVVAVAAYALAPGVAAAPVPVKRRAIAALRASAPFWAIAAVYFAARILVLGALQVPQEGAVGWQGTIFTAPRAAIFYLGQTLAPLWVAPAYPLRPVTLETAGLANFALPLAGVAVALAAACLLAGRRPVAWIGLALAVATLAPTLNVGAFPAEQIVHDRYLYLPVLGALMLLAPALASLLARALHSPMRGNLAAAGLLAAAAVPLAAATANYSQAWMTNLDLWRWAVRSDPDSAFNQHQLGVFLAEEGLLREAREAFDRSMAIQPRWLTRLGRAQLSIREDRLVDAERDLLALLEQTRHSHLAWEALAVVYERSGRLDDAIATLRSAREHMPWMGSGFSERIAIVHYQMGRRDLALAELEGARDAARIEIGADAKRVFFRLGLLYAELGRVEDARAALGDYLSATRGYGDRLTRQQREHAQRALAAL